MAEGENVQPGRGTDRKRSPRHVKAAARILQKEARKILDKHARRLAAEPAAAIRSSVEAIDTLRAKEDYEALEVEAERLDELLHQHASFARKSALRETLENIGIAVLIALGLRSCFYEPFKIPSGSMMPTLRKGDHIFVNKFTYGVQIPFTSTVVGESIGEIERGDVVVFRFPLDDSEDFIKRVIGLPGDEIKVVGRSVAIKRAGDEEFEVLEREKLDTQCLDQDSEHVVAGCQLYEETLGDKTYVVRYLSTMEEREDFIPKARVWKVPERHLLVMGDNRNESHDSLQWTVQVEAVSADALVTLKDLRDVTAERQFRQERPDDVGELGDPQHDRLIYMAAHRSIEHDVALSVWRSPPLSAESIFDAAVQQVPNARTTTVADLLENAQSPTGPELDRALQIGAAIDRLVVGRDEQARYAVIHLEPADAVLQLRCGAKICRKPSRLATMISDAVARFDRNHEQDTREILQRPARVRYQTNWSGRSDIRDHYFERAFAKENGEGPRDEVRLRTFRKPKQELELLLGAALHQAGSSAHEATAVPDLGEQAYLVEQGDRLTFVGADPVRDMLLVLDCGKARCHTREDALRLAQTVWSRMPAAAADRRKLKLLLQSKDVGRWPEAKVVRPGRNPFDRVRLEATVEGRDHSVEIELWRHPAGGLQTKVSQVGSEYGMKPDDSITQTGASVEENDAYHYVFGVSASDTVVRIRCRKGLCTDEDIALRLARRAAQKAEDPSNFVDPDAERPKPFVPRGNVKGRAERIWLPLDRFWLPIR